MTKTSIEWTDETWNPVTGCSKVSAGCKNCYAERIFQRPYPGRAFTDVRCHPERLDAPLRWRKPRMIFVNSMSDLFHEDVPDEFILKVFDVMRAATYEGGAGGGRIRHESGYSGHTFQVLTKRPERMRDFCSRLRFREALYLSPFGMPGFNPMTLMKNVWLGVSVEDQATAEARIPLLLQTPAAVRWISAEPLLQHINLCAIDLGDLYWLNALTGHVHIMHDGGMPVAPTYSKLDWVVAGGESGPHARPSHPDWFGSLCDQCATADVPFFFKQWGEWAPTYVEPGGDLGADMRSDRVRIVKPVGDNDGHFRRGDALMRRTGKKAAGRVLDGRTWGEYPLNIHPDASSA